MSHSTYATDNKFYHLQTSEVKSKLVSLQIILFPMLWCCWYFLNIKTAISVKYCEKWKISGKLSDIFWQGWSYSRHDMTQWYRTMSDLRDKRGSAHKDKWFWPCQNCNFGWFIIFWNIRDLSCEFCINMISWDDILDLSRACKICNILGREAEQGINGFI